MLKAEFEKEKATEICVTLPDNLNEYAKAFLNIHNNAREYPSMFYQVRNNSKNDVYVVCRQSDTESIREYLSQFGTINYIKQINKIDVIVSYSDIDELFIDDEDYVLCITD